MSLLTALIALPLLGCPAPVGGIDRTQVDAQAKWVAHIDIEALRSTQLFQELKAADKEGEMEKGLAEFADETGIQLFDDVFSVTAYGTALGEEHGVVIVQANAHAEAALAALQQKDGGKSVRIRERDCVQWGEGAEAGFSFLRPVTGADRRQIVVSKTQADLEQALDVLDKKRPGLDSLPQSDLYAAPAAGTFAFVAASGILEELAGAHGHDVKQVSAAARLAKGLRFELGETSGNLFLDLRLRTEKPEDAQRIQRIFDGLLALPGLMGGESEVGELIDSLTKAVKVEALNEITHVRFQYASKGLFAELQKLQAFGLEEHADEHLKALHGKGEKQPEEKPK